MAKKRGANEGSIFQLPDGRWRAVVSLGYRNGKRLRKVFEALTRQAVQRKLSDALTSQQHGLPIAAERETVGQFLTAWLEDVVKPSVKPKTRRTYADLCRLHLIPSLGKRPLARLSPHDVQAFLNEKLNFVMCSHCERRMAVGDFDKHQRAEHPDLASQAKNPALSARTVKHLLVTLRGALNVAVKWDRVPRNVAALVDPPKVPKPEFKVFTLEQARAFIEAVKGVRLEALFATAIALGYRQGEALGLQWPDVDLETGTLTVRQALQRVNGKLQSIPTKSDKIHTINLPAVTISVLHAHRSRQDDERRAAGARWRETGFVFTTGIGTPLDARGVIRAFDRILKDAGLPKIRFHDLRHSAATLLLAQGVSPRYVSELLAHSSVSFTMQTYAHVLDQTKREVAAQMDAILKPVATSVATGTATRSIN
jgi:integrase